VDKEWVEASRLWEKGKHREAFTRMSSLATSGYVFAQTTVGYFFDVGIGTRKNSSRALYWYRRAFVQGSASAANNVGTIYRDRGRRRLALHWFRRAVELGDEDASLESEALHRETPVSRAAA